MTLTLKNYTKELAKELISAAEKNKVRECDETEKGVFVAYVDEADESFDVSVTLLPNGELAASSCDCRNIAVFCRHKVALLIHVAKGKKVEERLKISKKKSKADTLLDQTEFSALKVWVKNLIQKNKDIELSFINSFSVKKQYHAPEEVINLINDALKATGCGKKKADSSQVKKLVELWAEVLQPIVQYYQSNITDENAFQSFHTLVEQCLYLHSIISSGSVRIYRYIEDLLIQSELILNREQHEDNWLLAANHFVQRIPAPSGAIRIHYVMHLKNIINAASNAKQEKLIGKLTTQYKMLSSENRLNWPLYTKIIFGIVKSNGIFTEHYKIFKPLSFENEFNEELISLLIENSHLALARQYCKAQIAANYREQYNIPYLKFLKKIYIIENDEINLASTLKELFPWTFDFDAYLFITGRMDSEEKKKWRTRVLSSARNAVQRYHYGALAFCFELMDHEKNYRKMTEYIDSHTPYAVILKYFEPMAATEKLRLIEAITRKSDSSWHLYSDKVRDDDSCFPALFALTEKYYSADFLRMVIKQLEKDKIYYYRPNRFMKYIKERLGE